MRIHIGPGSYPECEAALVAAGAEIVDTLAAAEGFLFTQTPGGEFPELHEGISWVQFPMAGINAYIERGIVTPGRRYSNAAGVYGEQVAEAALAMILGLYHLHPLVGRAESWSVRPAVDASTRWLRGRRVFIVGYGGIGRALENYLAPFHVELIRMRSQGIDGGYESFEEALAAADVVVLACPLTPETVKLMGRKQFAAMRSDALLINVARGEVVDTEALLWALDEGQIAGAGLDVTDPEPLPDGHPLWGRDNVIITPHTANTLASMDRLLAPVVARNYTQLIAGERMDTEVDPERGY
ncbi:dihydrofolate reductase [Corynebacterium sp. 13CS0277]|uniref:D-isomer specific 2-hydroxyacid dehydrogenase family protein n=1 Tax=Corynebacterium sp. 13CS0277 TaxID=2071994 RepID=UPI000D02F932|nr:D-isomer specific 2-hydroxyacid dehydrogenase family protein [Corynebacterium sp. 13CS0277]PRQ10910.1 dihydrofolate reductase [Corynebacterium sp. 13CS0277]